MKAAILEFWSDLVESFWFVPALMSAGAVIGSSVLIYLDRAYDLSVVAWTWSGGASGARSLLSTVATSMITVAGTVFSITIAALTLASQQFGPRLLRSFTVDRGNQIVLGTFVSTFLYCLLVLRTIRGQDEGQFVPNLSVSVAVLLACASLGVLIYFIHHLSSSIQAERLLASVGDELRANLLRLTPPNPPGPGHRQAAPTLPSREPFRVVATDGGYINKVNRSTLVSLAKEQDLLMRLPLRPGDFVSRGETVADIWATLHADIDDALAKQVCENIQIGRRRTPWQDSRYGIRQLTEIAARALSPGINDPFTAMGCLDWLVDSLGELAGRDMPTGVTLDKEGSVRLVEEPVGFAELLALGIEPVRSYGSDSVILVSHLMFSLARLAAMTSEDENQAAILHEARMALEAAEGDLSRDADRARAKQGFDSVARLIA